MDSRSANEPNLLVEASWVFHWPGSSSWVFLCGDFLSSHRGPVLFSRYSFIYLFIYLHISALPLFFWLTHLLALPPWLLSLVPTNCLLKCIAEPSQLPAPFLSSTEMAISDLLFCIFQEFYQNVTISWPTAEFRGDFQMTCFFWQINLGCISAGL